MANIFVNVGSDFRSSPVGGRGQRHGRRQPPQDGRRELRSSDAENASSRVRDKLSSKFCGLKITRKIPISFAALYLSCMRKHEFCVSIDAYDDLIYVHYRSSRCCHPSGRECQHGPGGVRRDGRAQHPQDGRSRHHPKGERSERS